MIIVYDNCMDGSMLRRSCSSTDSKTAIDMDRVELAYYCNSKHFHCSIAVKQLFPWGTEDVHKSNHAIEGIICVY